MSSGKSKQDEELLDQKIARIRKKNEEILRRRQEIEEDKKFAEQQNAMVKLRPSTDDWPRERTPALKPSQREMNFDDAETTMQEPANRNKDRGQPASRGRGETAGKGLAPPPDPVSFLADPERDYSMDKEKELPSFTRGTGRSFRDFKRDGPRRGRGFRGRGSFGHQRSSNNDDAWREERYRIDEARINRQKSADGKWRREWDSEKINLESQDEPASPSFTTPSSVSGRLDRWKHQPRHYESEDAHEPSNFRGRSFRGGGGPGRGGRGRGNYRVYPENSPPGSNAKVNISKFSPSSPPMPSKENYDLPVDQHSLSSTPNTNVVSSPSFQRIVKNVGDSFEVVVPNVSSENVSRGNESQRHNSRKGKFNRQTPSSERGYRQRLSHSQSSYSEDEYQKSSDLGKVPERKSHKPPSDSQAKHKKSYSSTTEDAQEGDKTFGLCKSQKPPLPPFRTSLPPSTISAAACKELEDGGEGSWEDVTTSGNESVGDDCSSLNTSPRKLESFSSESDCNFSCDSNLKDPTDIYTPEDFIQLVPADNKNTESATNFSDIPVSSLPSGKDTSVFETSEDLGKDSETDPSNMYTPDDFIKLVPPEPSEDVRCRSVENTSAISCTSNSSLPEKEESVTPSNLKEELASISEAPLEKSEGFNQVEKLVESDVTETSLKTNENIAIKERLQDLVVTTKTSETVQENDIENEKALSTVEVNQLSDELKQSFETEGNSLKANSDLQDIHEEMPKQ